MATKFDVYKDEDSPVIYDIDEERALQYDRNRSQEDHIGVDSQFGSINLTRKLLYCLLFSSGDGEGSSPFDSP